MNKKRLKKGRRRKENEMLGKEKKSTGKES